MTETETTKAKGKPTRYHVLREVEASEEQGDGSSILRAWTMHAHEVDAGSAKAAIEASVGEKDPGGYYVAVPARSWHPEPVAIQTEIKVRVGEVAQSAD